VVWAEKNYAKYKDIVDRAASLAMRGVRFEIYRNATAALDLEPKDLHGFVTVIPAGIYALTYWQNKGNAYAAVEATVPTPPISSSNRADLSK
jgi:uncharacterized protein